ncbi:MAG: exodeoxyribonuclease V subunit gamma, partial [Synechococcus sp. Tobar2m-G35]|nr:exodeoxyribonuclease V subunit gamma [Synechococcus sp. Tobar2m-G35]
MLRLIRSPSIEDLATALADGLAASRPADPIEPQQVLVSTNAMGRWLALAISERLGICAGIDFDFGGRHLRRLLRELAAQPEGPDPWEPDSLRWRLAAMLDGLPDTCPWQPLRQLWHRPDLPAGQLDGRRLQLLLELADTLDQYGLYRPGPVRRWLAGDDSGFDGEPLADDQRWQPALLRGLQEQAAAAGFDHPAQRLLQRPRPSTQGPLPALHVFAPTSLPPPFLQLLGQLVPAGRRPVLLYVLSACLDPWA